ncbi:GNAT family N-acetyltransferase [Roseateles toxinivorans]|uniref:[SSU ribosomal protein S5P]-alanine acetyltransferase n=1 Tax=Roseateles toxinivorans TaxID=270368 RepID=A0A4R6QM13_9BURK|nr:GNAT family N-acetyltransferase [Roseateles toxinivorans]TDP71529.1 [SSU ribosomal protein S5P]-alanine acetyltransferase [Roseateles toxinivorans]
MSAAQTQMHTPRLMLRAPSPALAPAVLDFYQCNAAHFAPWDPPLPEDFYDEEAIAARLQAGAEAFEAGSAYRYWITPAGEPGRILGQCHVSQVSRHAFQSAMLGYALDERAQGKGLMHEALAALVAEMFGPAVWLHRLQAAYRPENRRSGRVLERLGFAVEGLSKNYLFIDGGWRDHVLTALINPNWPAELSPLRA